MWCTYDSGDDVGIKVNARQRHRLRPGAMTEYLVFARVPADTHDVSMLLQRLLYCPRAGPTWSVSRVCWVNDRFSVISRLIRGIDK